MEKDFGYFEYCSCGSKANAIRYEGKVLILSCEGCGDEFEAHEETWLK